MRSLLETTFGPLWAPLGPLLGGSWASLGRPWASKMGSKRVTLLGKRVSFIPSCFFCRFFRLRSASGSPLGRILAPSWCHLGPSWNDCSAIFRRFLGIFDGFWGLQWMDSWINEKWAQSSQNNPARRNARSDPPPRLAGHGVLDSQVWLVSAVSDLLSQVFFLSSGCSFTLLKGSRRVQHSARPTASTLLDRLFFASFFGPRFLLILLPFLPPFCLPKSTQNRKKSEKMGLQIRVCFCFSFSADFL